MSWADSVTKKGKWEKVEQSGGGTVGSPPWGVAQRGSFTGRWVGSPLIVGHDDRRWAVLLPLHQLFKV